MHFAVVPLLFLVLEWGGIDCSPFFKILAFFFFKKMSLLGFHAFY